MQSPEQNIKVITGNLVPFLQDVGETSGSVSRYETIDYQMVVE